ncbi:MAG: GntR family transcriptional regulator [Eubacteriales bacterium]|jgi:DNA-binding GntR family transcriptional regulator
MHITQRLPGETARQYAGRMLRANIISLDLAPGSIVSENELAAQLGISRTPVREALIELSRTQIVEILPQRGSRISLIRYEMVEEARFVRLALENAIVEQLCGWVKDSDLLTLTENVALQRISLKNHAFARLMELDDAFHTELFRLQGMEQTWQLIRSMSVHFDRIRSMSVDSVKDLHIVEEHASILESLRQGDAPGARANVTAHLSRYRINKPFIQAKYPGYFAD